MSYPAQVAQPISAQRKCIRLAAAVGFDSSPSDGLCEAWEDRGGTRFAPCDSRAGWLDHRPSSVLNDPTRKGAGGASAGATEPAAAVGRLGNRLFAPRPARDRCHQWLVVVFGGVFIAIALKLACVNVIEKSLDEFPRYRDSHGTPPPIRPPSIDLNGTSFASPFCRRF